MEKNCTNCVHNVPLVGMNYSGVCIDTLQYANMTSKDSVCSRYTKKELPEEDLKTTFSSLQETIEALTCCTEPGRGCKHCPFARYECTCQQDLMFAALQLLSKQKSYIEVLERLVSGYTTDQKIWLTRNDMLEKENTELRAEIARKNALIEQQEDM